MSADHYQDLIVSDRRGPAAEAPFPQWADAPISPSVLPDSPSAALIGLLQLAAADPGDDAEAWHLPPPDIHTTGSQLRRRLVTPESIAALAAEEKPSLIRRIRALLPFRK